MIVMGIESSCDECAIALLEDGKKILSNVVATQIELHRPYEGVVPEIASRLHTQWIQPVFTQALEQASLVPEQIDAIAVTSRPGLIGSLLVGLSFAKGLSYSLSIPYIGVDHIKAHLHAAHIEHTISYPYLGVLVSGGHTVIAHVHDFDQIEVLGTTIDDAIGEAFDKVAKFYGLGYPGGVIIDRLAQDGDSSAFRFPDPSLHKGDHRYDVSYSGLKTAVINQLDLFWDKSSPKSPENIAASFQRAAVSILLKRVKKALADTRLQRVVAGGGVAANSLLRKRLSGLRDVDVYYPSLKLCTDNGAMIAAIGYEYLKRGESSCLGENASSRVMAFKHSYP